MTLLVRKLLVGCVGRVLGNIQVHPIKGDTGKIRAKVEVSIENPTKDSASDVADLFHRGSELMKRREGSLIADIDATGQVLLLEVGSPSTVPPVERNKLFGPAGLRIVPEVDGEYIPKGNGLYVFQANGQSSGRGPVRIFTRTGRGLGPQWGRRQTCILFIVPNEEKSPSLPSCSMVEIEEKDDITFILAGGNECARTEVVEKGT